MSQVDNCFQTQESKEKAINRARTALEARGVYYPAFNPALTRIQNHDAMIRYGEQEAALVAQYLKEPSGSRPITVYPAKINREWKGYPDD